MTDIVELTNEKADTIWAARRAEQVRAALPPTTTTRWVASRKAAVVAAVKHGVMTEEDVQVKYGISLEEFTFWRDSLERHGVSGLRATRAQRYRQG